MGSTTRALLRVASLGSVVGRLTGRRIAVIAVRPRPERFAPLAGLCLDGAVDLPIHATLGPDGVAEALALVGAGAALGKIVVRPDVPHSPA